MTKPPAIDAVDAGDEEETDVATALADAAGPVRRIGAVLVWVCTVLSLLAALGLTRMVAAVFGGLMTLLVLRQYLNALRPKAVVRRLLRRLAGYGRSPQPWKKPTTRAAAKARLLLRRTTLAFVLLSVVPPVLLLATDWGVLTYLPLACLFLGVNARLAGLKQEGQLSPLAVEGSIPRRILDPLGIRWQLYSTGPRRVIPPVAYLLTGATVLAALSGAAADKTGEARFTVAGLTMVVPAMGLGRQHPDAGAQKTGAGHGPGLATSSPIVTSEPNSNSGPHRPSCASLSQVRATLAAGTAPPPVQETLFRTWAYWNWPTVRCPELPLLEAGHWQVRTVDPNGTRGPVLVLAADQSDAELLHPEEGAVVQHRLAEVASLERRASFGRGTIQLLRMTDGSCGLAGHVFNQRAFYLPPQVLQAIAPHMFQWGAVPHLEPSETGSVTRLEVAFVGLSTNSVPARRVSYPTLMIRYDPSGNTAELEGKTYGRGTCPATLGGLLASAAAVAAAED